MNLLSFVKENGMWRSRLSSPGAMVVELETKTAGATIDIAAAIGGFKEVSIGQVRQPYSELVIFEIDLPAGVDIEIRSNVEVINGLYI